MLHCLAAAPCQGLLSIRTFKQLGRYNTRAASCARAERIADHFLFLLHLPQQAAAMHRGASTHCLGATTPGSISAVVRRRLPTKAQMRGASQEEEQSAGQSRESWAVGGR